MRRELCRVYGPWRVISRSQSTALPRKQKTEKPKKKVVPKTPTEDDKWELTVGIEIHAQLNSERKLFSGKWIEHVYR
jgi:hypothetical protein